MQQKSELDRIREEAEMKQRAVLWPDMLRSGRTVDEFLWKGSPRADSNTAHWISTFRNIIFVLRRTFDDPHF